MTKILISVLFLAVTAVQAQTTFPVCSIRPAGYSVQLVHCTDGRENCGNPQPIPYGTPFIAGAFYVIPKGQVVTMKTKSGEYQDQVQCILQQDIFPSLTQDANKKLFAFKLGNGQEVYTKEGKPWEESSFTRLGLPIQMIYNDTFK